MLDTASDHNLSGDNIYLLLRHYVSLGRALLLHSDLWDGLEEFCSRAGNEKCFDNEIARTIAMAQEAVIEAPWVCIAVRPRVGRWTYLRFHIDAKEQEEISVSEFLAFKERQVNGSEPYDRTLEVDLDPFNREFPRMHESRSIGRGVEFLNRRLSSQLFHEIGKGDRRILDFLRVHQCRGTQLMLNDRITDVTGLRGALREADDYLRSQPDQAQWATVGHHLQSLGF